jgi:hypothetical protein
VIVTSGTLGARLTVGRHVEDGVRAEDFDPVIRHVALADASPITVQATWSAWYRAEISLPHATADTMVALCARIVPRDR